MERFANAMPIFAAVNLQDMPAQIPAPDVRGAGTPADISDIKRHKGQAWEKVS
jgi:hypothetical protein